jgi:hypothetical protein
MQFGKLEILYRNSSRHIMNQSFFIDSIENIALAEGVIRMDCVVIEAVADNKPVGRRSASLAMPLSGFVRSTERFNQVMAKLVEQGILKKREETTLPADEKSENRAAASGNRRKK